MSDASLQTARPGAATTGTNPPAPAGHPAHRGSICLEDGRVLVQTAFEGAQWILRLQAPKCAARAQPGSFVHLSCDDDIPMRRPLSIMRVDPVAGWIEVLYKVLGPGLAALARRRVGDVLSVLGPIGHGFIAHPERPRTLLVGGGVGIPPMVFLAEALCADARAAWKPLVLMGSEIPFPFRARPSTILVPGIPDGVIACMPLLDGWGVPSRLASRSGFPGCHDGFVTELADLAAEPQPGAESRSRGVRLRTDPDARGNGEGGAAPRRDLPGVAGGVHGLRSRRLRRMRSARADAGRTGNETGLRRRPGVRCGRGVQRPEAAVRPGKAGPGPHYQTRSSGTLNCA